MKIFRCDHCQHLALFENTQCGHCGYTQAYLPDAARVAALESIDGGLWRVAAASPNQDAYRLCINYVDEHVCNWAVQAADPRATCTSCRLTRIIPDLSVPDHRDAWRRLETAKRRLIYTLLSLKLPLVSKQDDPAAGLAFEFLADDPTGGQPPIFTGHAGGVITVNIAEANDTERERRRALFHEPYRTLLGHLWHESGHYYWDRLIRGSARLAAFRDLFGDEQQDYAQSIRHHYQTEPLDNWSERYVSSYAGAHPWEDWAETWAHYLQMTDTLETAAACGATVSRRLTDDPAPRRRPGPRGSPAASFNRIVDRWFPLMYALDILNRGLGLPDAYPFVLSPMAIEKLRFVHETVTLNSEHVRP